ncbi:MAG: hypothetical protein V1835_03495 [Candidatus Micrarchaeota archaeon]
MESREIGIFLMGFGIAACMAFLVVYLQLSPLEADLQAAEPDVQALYDITHSNDYDGLVATSTTIVAVARQIAAIPFIGDSIRGEEIAKFADSSNSLLKKSKTTSEKVLPALRNALLVIKISFWGMACSVIIAAAGFWLYSKNSPAAQTSK